MGKVLKADIRQVLHTREFYISIVGMCLLNLMNIWDEIRLIGDPRDRSVFYFFIYRHGLGAFAVLNYTIAVMPYALSHAQEFQSGYFKSVYLRTGRIRYAWSKTVATALSGFVVVLCGYALEIFLLHGAMSLFPDTSMIETYAGQTAFMSLAEKRSVLFFVCILVQEGIAAAFLCVVTLAVSAFVKNKYMLLCIPVIALNGWSYFCGTFQLPAIFSWDQYMYAHLLEISANEYHNLAATILYYLSGIGICGMIFSKCLKRELEHV